LQLLTRERDEAEATALARLVAGLELANHELGDRAKGDLSSGGGVVLEDLEELVKPKSVKLACRMNCSRRQRTFSSPRS
jgi:hypothetical protein